MSNSFNRNRNYEDDLRYETLEKDSLIKKLYSHIYEMEKNEVSFQKLSNKFKSLQIDFNNLLDDKIRLEHELKQKTEISNKQLSDIRYDIENLQLSLNDKINQNKKMCNDYSNLQNILENKNNEIDILRKDIAVLIDDNNILKQEKNKLELNIQDLRDIKRKNITDLDQVSQENQKLNKIIRDDESIIKNLESERNRLLNIAEDLKLEVKELTNTLRIRDDSISYQNKQIDEANINANRLENFIRDLELKNSELKNEINDKMYIIQKESRIKNDREKDIEVLDKIIKEKERENQKFIEDIKYLHNEKNKLYEDNTRMFNELDKLKNHIYIITDQNQQLCEELDRIKEQDEKIKHHLNRKERISNIIKNNTGNIEGSLKQIEEINHKGADYVNHNSLSPLQGSFRATK